MRTAAVVALGLAVSAHAQCVPRPEPMPVPFTGIYTLGTFRGELIAGGLGYVRRWDGTEWSPVGAGLDGDVLTLGEHRGELVAGGTFRHSGPDSMPLIARFDGTAWRDIGGGLAHGATWDLGVVLAVTEYRGQLLVGGNFQLAGGKPADFMARWTGSEWIEVPGWEGPPHCMAVFDGKVYAGGNPEPLRRYACRPCVADVTGDDVLDFADYLGFLSLYDAGELGADLGKDDAVDPDDWLVFLGAFAHGCP